MWRGALWAFNLHYSLLTTPAPWMILKQHKQCCKWRKKKSLITRSACSFSLIMCQLGAGWLCSHFSEESLYLDTTVSREHTIKMWRVKEKGKKGNRRTCYDKDDWICFTSVFLCCVRTVRSCCFVLFRCLMSAENQTLWSAQLFPSKILSNHHTSNSHLKWSIYDHDVVNFLQKKA